MVGLLYGLAVLLTGQRGIDPRTGAEVYHLQWVNPELMLQVALATVIVVGGASLFRIAALSSGGGRAVAEGLGGVLLHSNSSDPAERKILNEDAVIGITRGAIESLSRDELQGVVAHEFSHILNGDMRLNIRLMGVLFGILVIGLIGNTILRSSFYAGAMRRRDDRGGVQAMLLIGGGLMLIGFIGTLIGNIIKASVSRQREFLADASAVQYTRNPDGIAGALKKIGGFEAGSQIANPQAQEASHLFFGQALSSGLNSVFATHPPLEERIERLDPAWQAGERRVAPAAPGSAAGAMGFAAEPAANALDQIGNVTRQHLDYAQEIIAGMPAPVIEAAHEPYGARAVIYALLLDPDPQVRAHQLEILPQHAEPDVERLTRELAPGIDALGTRARIPLIDLALPALRELSKDQYRRFSQVVSDLVKADDRITLFEWALQRILMTHLRPSFARVRPPRVKHSSMKRLAPHCEVVLSTLSGASSRAPAASQRAFDEATAELGLHGLRLLPRNEVGLAQIDEALFVLAEATPQIKRSVLSACAHFIAADHQVTLDEAELFRAIGDTLGCPVPPLLPGQPLAA